jgi:hypothetical protein
MPPSMTTSRSEPTASQIGLTIRIAAGVPSRLLPPWLETEMAWAPASRARRASSMRQTPLSMNGLPPLIWAHCSRIHATSSQDGGGVVIHS